MSGRRSLLIESGVLSALYVGAITWAATQLTGIGARAHGAATALCVLVGLGVYLLDRVGIGAPNPADGWTWPRHASEQRAARALALACLLSASVLGWFVRPWLVAAPLVGLAVVALYMGIGGVRLKNSVWLKGPVVAVCLVSLGVLASDSDRALAGAPGTWTVLVGLVLLVLGDCVLSDLDDLESDRAAGAGSIAAIAGVRAARTAALALHVLAGATWLAGPTPALTGAVWGGGVVLTTAMLVIARPARVRALVDARAPMIAVGVWLMTRG